MSGRYRVRTWDIDYLWELFEERNERAHCRCGCGYRFDLHWWWRKDEPDTWVVEHLDMNTTDGEMVLTVENQWRHFQRWHIGAALPTWRNKR